MLHKIQLNKPEIMMLNIHSASSSHRSYISFNKNAKKKNVNYEITDLLHSTRCVRAYYYTPTMKPAACNKHAETDDNSALRFSVIFSGACKVKMNKSLLCTVHYEVLRLISVNSASNLWGHCIVRCSALASKTTEVIWCP